MLFERKQKGSIIFWMLVIAVVGLTLVVGFISSELLIRWVSLARVQNAANEAALVYARDMIRLRDQALSELNTDSITFEQSGVPYECGAQPGGCTELVGDKASIPGATNLEYLNASQVLLFNLWGERLDDPSKVDNVQQNQCYKPHNESRFSKIPISSPNNCDVNYKVSSPIMSLTWAFRANPYGTGLCCASGGNDADKDFCVDVVVQGRMDPVIAGGLPFLSSQGVFSDSATSANGRQNFGAIEFITEGNFEIHARAVVLRMDASKATSDEDGIASNLSGETTALEFIPTATCPASPPAIVNPTANPFSVPNAPALSIDYNFDMPPDEMPPPVDPPMDPPTPPTADCPPEYSHCSTFSQSNSAIHYQCCPPPPPTPPPPPNPADVARIYIETGELPDDWRVLGDGGGRNSGRGTCVMGPNGQYGAYGQDYSGSCYCPIVIPFYDLDENDLISEDYVKFSFDGKSLVKTYWINSGSKLGFLSIDLNGNGIIDNGSELFGQFTNDQSYQNGYEALASLKDINKDGLIKDDELKGLLLWFDTNHDGISQKSEIKSYKDLNIIQIDSGKHVVSGNKPIWNGNIYPYSEKGVIREVDGVAITTKSYDLWFEPYIDLAQIDNEGLEISNNSNKIGIMF